MPDIKLPDGSIRSFEQPVTIAEVAASIGAGLARAALAGKVDGKLVDTSYLIEQDVDLAIVTDRDADGVEVIRHSTAHLLAYAVKELFPEAQVTIGPVIENGFYYDFAYKRPFTPEDLASIEKRMAELATLFFSSQGHITMGGYDLFRSELQSNNIWSNPVNLGYPLNNPDDNIFFMPSANGKSGYYSIYKEAEGSGNYDIYKITFK